MNIIWRGSPNYRTGRTQPISKIVVHWMVGTLASADSRFMNPTQEASAHYGIENNTIYQWVKEADTAWHAVSANPFSIGIEHSAAPDRPASEATYQSSIQLVADICKRHNLDPRTAVQPHKLYVATACPGTLDVARIRAEAYKLVQGEPVPFIEPATIKSLFSEFEAGVPTEDQLKYYSKHPGGYAELYKDLLYFKRDQVRQLKAAPPAGTKKVGDIEGLGDIYVKT